MAGDLDYSPKEAGDMVQGIWTHFQTAFDEALSAMDATEAQREAGRHAFDERMDAYIHRMRKGGHWRWPGGAPSPRGMARGAEASGG